MPFCHLGSYQPFLLPRTRNLHDPCPRLVMIPTLSIISSVKMVGYNASPKSSDELEHPLHPFYPLEAVIKGWSTNPAPVGSPRPSGMLTRISRLCLQHPQFACHSGLLFRADCRLPATDSLCPHARTPRPGTTAQGVRYSHVVRALRLHPPSCRGECESESSTRHRVSLPTLKLNSTLRWHSDSSLRRATSSSTTQPWPPTPVSLARCGRSTRCQIRAI